jgi:hypothetical protein
MRTVLSPEPEAMRVPSGENTAEVIERLWPLSNAICLAVRVFQIRIVLSPELKAIRVPSEENTTNPPSPAYFSGRASFSPVCQSQMRTELSHEPQKHQPDAVALNV